MEVNKMIAVMGSPGSGKTTTSIKLAMELANKKKNVVVVFNDPFTPVIPIVVPCPGKQVSVGELLTAPILTQKMILDACVPVKENEYISLLGYCFGDNFMRYPQMTRDRVVDFLVCLRYLADYIIFDCTTICEADILSMLAMELSDSIIKIGTSNLRGISYFESHRIMLSDPKFKPEMQMQLIGNLKQGQEWETVAEQYNGVAGVLPYVPELEMQYDERTLFTQLTSKESIAYKKELCKVLNQVSNDSEKSVKPKIADVAKKHPENKRPVKKSGRGFNFPIRKSKGEF